MTLIELNTKNKKSVIFLVCGLLFLTSFCQGCTFGQVQNTKHYLTIKYDGNTNSSYIISLEPNKKQVILQSNSWKNDEKSRFSLYAYSLDNGTRIQIPRNATGDFALDISGNSDHLIVFYAVKQYPLNITGTDSFNFSQPSPTGDNWFDYSTDTQVIVPYVIPTNKDDTRVQLAGWSLDEPDIYIIPRHESGYYESHKISFTDVHTMNFEYKLQYFIRVISDFGRPTGTGWYDSGKIISISVIPGQDFLSKHDFLGWQGPIIGHGNSDSANVLVSSPETLVAIWSEDYTLVSIIGILAVALGTAVIIYHKRKQHK